MHERAPLLLALLLVTPAAAQVPKIFGDHMVLQRDRAVPVWGTAAPGAQVTVRFAGQKKTAAAGADGAWRVELDPMAASSEGRDFVVDAGARKVYRDVLVGEVWVCSGQSNMEWTVRASGDAAAEIEAAKHPLIRHIKVPRRPADVPQTDVDASWTVCSPQTVANYTAVGYYFARELQRELNVPIGLVNSSWGGTRIEPWIPLQGYKQIADAWFARNIIARIEAADPSTPAGKKQFGIALASYKRWVADSEKKVANGDVPSPAPELPTLGRSHQDPTRLYRGMVHPLVPYAMRGAIWYQGESNGSEGSVYETKMRGLIEGWRSVWGQGAFPFYHVQLANFTEDKRTPEGGDGYAHLRDAQRRSLEIENTGMAVIIDIGETRDIHPKNKQDVGARLARWALNRDYGKTDVVSSGPLYKSHEVEGDKIRVRFDHVGGGLMVGRKEGRAPTVDVPNGALQRFAIAGADKQWVWADAKIDGDTVVVSSPKVGKPVAVRYAFSANPLGANLYNRAGLPASPFRTDSW